MREFLVISRLLSQRTSAQSNLTYGPRISAAHARFNRILQVVGCAPCNTCFLRPTRVHNPQSKRHLDRFSHFCTAHECDRPTDWPRYSVCRPHLRTRSTAMPAEYAESWTYLNEDDFILILSRRQQWNSKSQIPLRYLVPSWSATSFEPARVMEFGHEPASSC